MNIDKLKEHQKVVDSILLKNDTSYKAQKDAENKNKLNAEELTKKMDTLLTTKTDTQNTLGNVLMDKLMSTFIKEFDPFTISQSISSLTPVINELKLVVSQLKIPQLTSKELGTDKIITSVTSLEQALKKGSHEVDLAEIVNKLEDVTVGINQLVNKVVPEFPKTLSIQTIPSVEKKLDTLVETIKSIPQNMPKVMPSDNSELLAMLKEVKEAVAEIKMPEIEFPTSIDVNNFPIQKIPQPVTHISINSLKGFAKTTTNTVTTSLTPLPTYGVLDNRRSIIIYNNDSSTTLYLGGSDVTTSNGMPVPPLSYSPILDAGINLIIYGIAASSINVRVLEISDEASGR